MASGHIVCVVKRQKVTESGWGSETSSVPIPSARPNLEAHPQLRGPSVQPQWAFGRLFTFKSQGYRHWRIPNPITDGGWVSSSKVLGWFCCLLEAPGNWVGLLESSPKTTCWKDCKNSTKPSDTTVLIMQMGWYPSQVLLLQRIPITPSSPHEKSALEREGGTSGLWISQAWGREPSCDSLQPELDFNGAENKTYLSTPTYLNHVEDQWNPGPPSHSVTR